MNQSELQPINKRTHRIMEHDQYHNGSSQAKIQILVAGGISNCMTGLTTSNIKTDKNNYLLSNSISASSQQSSCSTVNPDQKKLANPLNPSANQKQSNSNTSTESALADSTTNTSSLSNSKPGLSSSSSITSSPHTVPHSTNNPSTSHVVNNISELSMFIEPHFLILLHLITSGKQGEDFGVDESPVVSLNFAIYDVENERVTDMQSWFINPANPNEIENMESSANEGTSLLSEECRTITGITEDDIQRGLSLEEALNQFDKYLQAHTEHSPHKRFCVATFGQHALRLVLHHEATAKNINLYNYPYFFSFFDLCKAYMNVYSDASAVSWEDLQNKYQGHLDSKYGYGLSVVWKLADLVGELLMKGYRFKEPESIDKNYYPALIKKTDPIDDDVVVRARGLPWQATDCDIQRFFRGLNIAPGGIALVLSRVGRRNGEALIRFINSEHRDLALKKHKHHMNQRYIEVYMATGRDFSTVAGGETEEAEAFLKQMGDTSQTLVRMRGLPYTATAEQILEFFENNGCIVQNGVHGVLFVNHKDGRATGDAFVLFENEKMAEKALQNHRRHIGSRYIELFKSTPAEVNQVMNSMQTSSVSTTSAPPATVFTTSPSSQLVGMFPFPSLLEMEALTIMQLQQSQLAVHPQQQQHQHSHNAALLSAVGVLPTNVNPSASNLSSMVNVLSGGMESSPPPLLPNVSTSGLTNVSNNAYGSANNNNYILTPVGYASPRCFIHIRAMPVEASVADILTFLGIHSHNIVYQGVHMVFDALDQPVGEAIVQMVNEIAAAAVVEQKNKAFFTIPSSNQVTGPGNMAGNAGANSSVSKRTQVEVTFCTPAEASQFAQTSPLNPSVSAATTITPLMLTGAGPGILSNGGMNPATMAALLSSGMATQGGGPTSPLMMLPMSSQMGQAGALNVSLLAAAAAQQQQHQQQQQNAAAAAAMLAMQSQSSMPHFQAIGPTSRHSNSSSATAMYPPVSGQTTLFFPAATSYPCSSWPATFTSLNPATLSAMNLMNNTVSPQNPSAAAAAAAAAMYFNNAAALAAASGHPGAGAFFPSANAAATAAAVAAAASMNFPPNVVIIKGLPKDVTQNELMSLFDGVLVSGILPEVNLCYSSEGCPTGEAVITFHTQAEAERASRECNRRYVRNQFIEVIWPHSTPTFLSAN